MEAIGLNITQLDLYAVDQIDLKAVAMISIYCRKLGIIIAWYLHNQQLFERLNRSGNKINLSLSVKLGFSQCGFKPTIEELYYEGTEESEQRPPRQELPVEKLIENFKHLESFKFSSHAHPDYVR